MTKLDAISAQQLANFSPFNHLIESHRNALTNMLEIVSLDIDADLPVDTSQFQYLLSGQVELLENDSILKSISAGSQESYLPLGRQSDQHSIKTSKPSQVLSFDRDMVNLFLAWNEIAASQNFNTDEISNVYPQWAAEIMNNPVFESIPGEALQAILMNLEPVPAQTGEIIIKQGASGEYYYIIAKGECVVTELGKNLDLIHLANLQAGQAFGEESLLSDLPCNATVTMVSDGILLRINKSNFNRLIKEPSIRWVDSEESEILLKAGAQLIDIRQREEFQIDPVEGATNLPLRNLRKLSHELDRGTTYIIHNRGGMRCAAAAYLLAQRKFDVRALRVN